MHTIKGAIFSLTDVLVKKGKMDQEKFEEVAKLLRFLLSKGIQPVLVSNNLWTLKPSNVPFHDFLSKHIGVELPYYQGGVHMDYKQTASAMNTILADYGWVSHEVVYVGSTNDDMRAASNGGLLFLAAKWHGEHTDYGFEFSSPKDIGRFIDCCCITPKEWFWGIEDGNLRCYSIAPLGEYSKQYPTAAAYSTDAKNAAKFGVGDLRFWGLLMAARIHLSGIGAEASYAVPYPGHSVDSEKAKLMTAVQVVAGSLRARYLQDFIVRHTNAPKSQNVRNKGGQPSPESQLSTICLRRDPLKTGPKGGRYKSPPSIAKKTVLVVDDICTQGFSLEAARAFIEAAGGKVVALSWLKTPGPNDYHEITSLHPPIDNPFQAYAPQKVSTKVHQNAGCVMNASAANEIADAFTRFSSWDWPD